MGCRAYDAAAVQLLGPAAVTNFNRDDVMAALPQAAAEQVSAASAPAPSQAPQISIQLPFLGTFLHTLLDCKFHVQVGLLVQGSLVYTCSGITAGRN